MFNWISNDVYLLWNIQEVSSRGLQVMESLNDAMLSTKLSGENTTLIKVAGLAVSLNKQSPDRIAGSTIIADRGRFGLPPAESLFRGHGERNSPFLTTSVSLQICAHFVFVFVFVFVFMFMFVLVLVLVLVFVFVFVFMFICSCSYSCSC